MAKKKDIDKIKAVIKAFEKFQVKLEMEKECTEENIKDFYRKNRNPPAALLMRWKQIQNLEVFTENNIYSFGNQLQIAEVGQSLEIAMGSKKVEKQMEKIQEKILQTQNVIQSFNTIQTDLLQQGALYNKNIEIQQSSLDKIVDQEKIAKEILGPIDEDESLIEIIKEDPNFINIIDEETKNRIQSKLTN